MLNKKCRKCKENKKVSEFPKMNLGKYGVWSTCFSCMKLWQKPQTEIKRTPVAKVWKKRAERLKSWDTEVKAYRKVYEIRKHCFICWKFVLDPQAWCFPHILSKKDYPHLRTFANNITLVCGPEHHQELDKLISGQNKKELEKRILNGEIIY